MAIGAGFLQGLVSGLKDLREQNLQQQRSDQYFTLQQQQLEQAKLQFEESKREASRDDFVKFSTLKAQIQEAQDQHVLQFGVPSPVYENLLRDTEQNLNDMVLRGFASPALLQQKMEKGELGPSGGQAKAQGGEQQPTGVTPQFVIERRGIPQELIKEIRGNQIVLKGATQQSQDLAEEYNRRLNPAWQSQGIVFTSEVSEREKIAGTLGDIAASQVSPESTTQIRDIQGMTAANESGFVIGSEDNNLVVRPRSAPVEVEDESGKTRQVLKPIEGSTSSESQLRFMKSVNEATQEDSLTPGVAISVDNEFVRPYLRQTLDAEGSGYIRVRGNHYVIDRLMVGYDDPVANDAINTTRSFLDKVASGIAQLEGDKADPVIVTEPKPEDVINEFLDIAEGRGKRELTDQNILNLASIVAANAGQIRDQKALERIGKWLSEAESSNIPLLRDQATKFRLAVRDAVDFMDIPMYEIERGGSVWKLILGIPSDVKFKRKPSDLPFALPPRR